MRRIFEEFLQFKQPGTLSQASQIDKILEIYREACNTTTDASFERELGELLNYINASSHNIEIKGNEKVVRYSLRLMRYIKTADPVHYNSILINLEKSADKDRIKSY